MRTSRLHESSGGKSLLRRLTQLNKLSGFAYSCVTPKKTNKKCETFYRLSACGLNPWLDEKNLLPGQLWKSEITQAIRESDCVLVCLSQTAVTKTGYIHKEIREALDRADEQPPGRIFLIPLRFEQCDVSERFREIHWVDYFEPDGYERLILAIAQIEKCLHQMSERASEIRTVA
jgi:hypothetical protein